MNDVIQINKLNKSKYTYIKAQQELFEQLRMLRLVAKELKLDIAVNYIEEVVGY